METQTLNRVLYEKASHSDHDVIREILSGKTNRYEILMRKYNQRLYRASYSILNDSDAAQDAIQQTYITAYYKLDTYLPTASFGAWLTKIAINESLMMKRKARKHIALNDSYIEDILIDTTLEPDILGTNKELSKIIETAIGKLPEEFRLVFVLRDIQKLSTKETAESLGLKQETVKTRLHRARNLMQGQLNLHIEEAGLHVFEFAGSRCDSIVSTVFSLIERTTNELPRNTPVH